MVASGTERFRSGHRKHRKYGRNDQGRFQPGNPGRPAGARNRSTIAAEALLDTEAKKLVRKAMNSALDGDVAALRLCLERILPVRRERAVRFEMPALETPEDATRAAAALARAVAEGEVTPTEAESTGRVIETWLKARELQDVDATLRAVEEAVEARGHYR